MHDGGTVASPMPMISQHRCLLCRTCFKWKTLPVFRCTFASRPLVKHLKGEQSAAFSSQNFAQLSFMEYPRQVWNAKSKFRMMTKKRDQLLLLQTMSSRGRWRWTIPETAGEHAASRSALFVAGKLSLPTGICKSNRSMPLCISSVSTIHAALSVDDPSSHAKLILASYQPQQVHKVRHPRLLCLNCTIRYCSSWTEGTGVDAPPYDSVRRRFPWP